MRIVFSGGGTGGHIYPALAIRENLLKKFAFSSFYVGVSGGMEEKIVSREKDLPFYGVRAQGMPRTFSLNWLTFPLINAAGIVDAFKHLKDIKPDLVVTTGGFVAFPVLAAARLLGIPAVMHEQNAAMGVTNRLFAGSASRVLLTYASAASEDGKRVFVTGNPVRSAFLSDAVPGTMFARDADEFVVLAVGGSRGALSLNKACIDLVKNWLPQHPGVKLIHISGDRDFEMVKTAVGEIPPNYILLPYLHEMKEAFSAADILVSRAGATILAEIAVCRKPAILVPFPFATDNHQEKNARVLEDLGAAKMLLDKDLNGGSLAAALEELRAPDKLQLMARAMATSRPADVEDRILQQIVAVLRERNINV